MGQLRAQSLAEENWVSEKHGSELRRSSARCLQCMQAFKFEGWNVTWRLFERHMPSRQPYDT